MRLNTLRPNEHLVARIGSPEAKLLMEFHPDLDRCVDCKADVWVSPDRAARKGKYPLICTECLGPPPF